MQRQRLNRSQLKTNQKLTTIVVLDSETQISQQLLHLQKEINNLASLSLDRLHPSSLQVA